MRRRMIAGNWKMNGGRASLKEVERLRAEFADTPCEVVICPPAILIPAMVEALAGSSIMVGGQDCHPDVSGAYTGDLSAPMLVEAGATHVILGHSERRALHSEGNSLVCAKASSAHKAGLAAIICVGETAIEREEGRTLAVIGRQLRGSVPAGASPENCIIAYEPVWAIGSGRTPTPPQIAAVHAFIRGELVQRFHPLGGGFRLLYGGSVKPLNARDIFSVPDVDGALVGGASLTAAEFGPIIAAACL